jgi:NAD(P)-dependent dehydrogenase (short-subunit alcohol dehydrogenase family)
MGLKALDLEGRIAVVVGGTSGLGRAAALALAEAGADVVASSRSLERVCRTADEIEALGRTTLRKAVNAASRASIDELRDAVLDRFGAMHILVNAVGRTLKKPVVEFTEDEWREILDANVTTVLRACQSFYEPLKQSGRGRVINIASMASFRGFFQVAPYGAGKAGVAGLTQAIAVEWARAGIHVNAVVPGMFPTAFNFGLLNGTERGREMLSRTPLGRFGSPEEIAGAVVLLASDAASFITGATIAVDGGYLASGVNS